ncbi:unnamed protein product [Rotaria sordida]|uniref:PDZ domain-containing protein n=1 Tax=Rotaria sordida TaxID=392033 RepID=A0A814PUI8_9BILA|nr:unnamed protein product [Rotaria sordida]
MENIEQKSHSYYRLHEKIALVSLLKKEMKKHSTSNRFSGNFSCVSSDTHSPKTQRNTNNNNNISPQPTDEQNTLLQFYIVNVSRERNLHLSTCSYDKRLLIFFNISNGLHKLGVRNGDILIFLNQYNILQPPIALTIDRVKSEFSALRRKNKLIQIGICRSLDQSLYNNTTIKHLSTLTFNEFENLSQNEEFITTNEKSSINIESKKLLNLFSTKRKSITIQKRNSNSYRDSGFVETDVDHSLISNSNKYRSKTSPEQSEEDDSMVTQKSFDLSDEQSIKKKTKTSVVDQVKIQSGKQSSRISSRQLLNKYRQSQNNLPTEILTDGCFIYRRQIIKKPTSNAVILRGREIAYQAANSPTIPSSMPNYTDDQIRELYGELDKNTRRLQENEYIFHTPMIDAWNEKSSSNQNQLLDKCPLPKFHIDKNNQTILMTTYLSTGLSNPRIISNDKETIRGSFRTSIADRTTISPSPILLNVDFDYNKLTTISTDLNDQSAFLEDSQQKTSINSIDKQSEIIDSALSSFDLHTTDHHSSPQHFNEESIALINNVNSIAPKIISSPIKTSETMDIDSLIDLDDETTISYNTAEEFRMETDPDSILSNKNNERTNIHHCQSINTDALFTHNDYLNIIKSSENNSSYDPFMPSIEKNQQNIFTDNYQSSSTINIDHLIIKDKDIDKNSSIYNLIKIIYDINQKQSDHSPIIFHHTKTQTEKESKINEKYSNIKMLTDNQNKLIKVNNSNVVIDQSLSVTSQELTDKSVNEFNNLEAIIHKVESLIKQSIEPEQNLNILQTNLSSINNLSQIFNDSFLKNQNDDDDDDHDHHQLLINDENNYHQKINDIDEDFEELYQHYVTDLNQYQTKIQHIDKFEQNQHILTPITEESITLVERSNDDKIIKINDNEQYCLLLTVQRQSNHIGHYGFELEQTINEKIIISSIIDSNYCPHLNIGDEIISINHNSTLITLEQCHLLFHSLWYNQCEYVQIVVNKPIYTSIIPMSESMSLQSSSLSWPLSIAESGKIIAVFF